jgi:hypothetical protein
MDRADRDRRWTSVNLAIEITEAELAEGVKRTLLGQEVPHYMDPVRNTAHLERLKHARRQLMGCFVHLLEK